MASSVPPSRSYPDHVPAAPFVRLSALWIQVSGTWCNLECRPGWWTTCIENLPAKQRARGKF